MGVTSYSLARRRRRLLQGGLSVLAAAAGWVGIWAIVAPRSFFEGFPGAGLVWVAALPPYNEHLVRDVGGLYLGFAILFAVAAATLERHVVVASLAAWLPFALLHLAFHLLHDDVLSRGERILQALGLGFVLVLPALLLVVTVRGQRQGGVFSRR